MLLIAAALMAAPTTRAAALASWRTRRHCPATTSYYAWDRGKSVAPRKLDELPPANVYATVYRRVDGCEAPVIVKYRSWRPVTRLAQQPRGISAMSRATRFLFAIICYAIFFATFLYLIVFVGDFAFATITVDNGPQSPLARRGRRRLRADRAVRPSTQRHGEARFKAKWTRIVPPPVERSVFVLAASIALIIVFLAGGRSTPSSGT